MIFLAQDIFLVLFHSFILNIAQQYRSILNFKLSYICIRIRHLLSKMMMKSNSIGFYQMLNLNFFILLNWFIKYFFKFKMYTYFCLFVLSCFVVVNCHQNHHQDQQVFQQNGQHQQAGQHHQNSMMENINKDHVLEHLDGVINKPKDQMTIDEQNFYYFKLHDYDNNNMLDGLELVSAFAHSDGIFINQKL